MQYYVATPDYYNDYMMHYGVKGMKWGVRKQIASFSRGYKRRKAAKEQAKIEKIKARKARRGYSEKTYNKFKAQGMTHKEAVEAAKKDRRKKVTAIAVGAAALTLTALAAKTAYDRGFNLKGMSQREVFDKRAAKRAAKDTLSNFKFKNEAEYRRARSSAAETEWLKAGKKGDPNDFYKYVDDDTIKKYAKMLRK